MFRVFIKFFILILLGTGFYFTFTYAVNHMVKEKSKQSSYFVEKSHIPARTNTTNHDNSEIGFVEGKQYQNLSAKITTQKVVQDFVAQDPGKVQVLEFFNYGCFWCSKLHPILEEWVKRQQDINKDIVFYRIPIVFNKQWEVLAKAFYVNNLKDKPEQDEIFFKAIHQDHINLSDEKQLKDFFKKQGMDEAKFNELYHSFAVNRELTHGNTISNTYQVTVSPAIILNTASGSYFISPQMTGGIQGVITVLDFLMTKDKAH